MEQPIVIQERVRYAFGWSWPHVVKVRTWSCADARLKPHRAQSALIEAGLETATRVRIEIREFGSTGTAEGWRDEPVPAHGAGGEGE